jgi:hypothetical protein
LSSSPSFLLIIHGSNNVNVNIETWLQDSEKFQNVICDYIKFASGGSTARNRRSSGILLKSESKQCRQKNGKGHVLPKQPTTFFTL